MEEDAPQDQFSRPDPLSEAERRTPWWLLAFLFVVGLLVWDLWPVLREAQSLKQIHALTPSGISRLAAQAALEQKGHKLVILYLPVPGSAVAATGRIAIPIWNRVPLTIKFFNRISELLTKPGTRKSPWMHDFIIIDIGPDDKIKGSTVGQGPLDQMRPLRCDPPPPSDPTTRPSMGGPG